MFKSIKRSAILMGLGIIAIAASGAFAEETQNLQVGAKVRATLPKISSAYTLTTSGNETAKVWMDDFEAKPLKTERSTKLTGTLLDIDGTTITLEISPDEPPVKILRQDISKLELFKGNRSGDAGGWLGFVVGAGLGYLMGKTAGDDPPPDEFMELSVSAGTKAGFGAVVFGVLGARIGYEVYGGDEWETVPDNQLHLDLQIDPTGAPGVSISFLF